MERDLKFRDDGTFTIVQFTDVHWVDGGDEDKKTRKVMEAVLEKDRPDLVIFTGDTVYGDANLNALDEALETVNKAGIPWASVFGNHDDELGAGKDDLLKKMQESSLCLTQAGDEGVSGVGNYYLSICADSMDKPSWILYLMDSGSYTKNKIVGGYDFFKRDQIQWYVEKSCAFKEEFGPLPALMFFHIPLSEYNDVWDFNVCYGEKNENVCCPKQNSGLFSAMLEMGDVKGVFTGHDHINDYYGDLYGIKLIYGRATGYNTYCKDGFAHGARVIRLRRDNTSFETWVRLEDGSVINNPVPHEPERQR